MTARTLPCMAALAFAFAFVWSATSLADETIDEMMANPAGMGTIKALASLSFCHNGTPESIARDKAEVKRQYWAFMPDVNLTGKEIAEQTRRFEDQFAALIQITAEYKVTQVSFLGCDTWAGKCMDMYFASVTPKGPVLFRYSLELKVNDKVRIMGIETYTGWDKVKQIARDIQHAPSATRVPTITYNPASVTSPTSPTSQPADGRL